HQVAGFTRLRCQPGQAGVERRRKEVGFRMTSNLKIKVLVIVVVILACIYGIIGLPTSKEQLVANWQKNIHLGLDLKGGSQLVLQVQIQDAFKAEADTVIQRLKDQLGVKGIAYADMSRNDPPTIQAADTIEIDVKSVPAKSAGDFRAIVNENYTGIWNLVTVNPTDYRLTM